MNSPSFPTAQFRQGLHSLLPWLVLAGALAITALVWQLTAEKADREARSEFWARAALLESTIHSHMQVYEQILHGASGLFAATPGLDRQAWRSYVESLHLDERYPGTLALAYTAHLPPGRVEAHERAVRAQGYPNYAVWPAGPRAEYSSIVYIEPFSGRNLRAFGFDMLSEPVRREAMDRARRTGEAALSGKVRLVQESGNRDQAGTLLYLPVYRKDAPLDSEARRKSALLGWVYQPYRMADLMHGLLPDGQLDLDIALYDGAVAPERLLYPAEPPAQGNGGRPAYARLIRMPLYGQVWLMQVSSTPAFERQVATDRPALIAGGGALISLLCFGLTWSLVRTRSRALRLAEAMTIELSESERRFRDLFENSPFAYLSMDAEGHYLDANDRLCEMLGYAREELLGRPFADLVPEARHAQLREHCAQLESSGSIVAELQLTRKDGTLLTAIVEGRVQRGADGAFVRTHCILTDISQRKRMEEELRQSRAELSEAIEAGDVGLWRWNLATDEVYYSPEFKRQIGYRDDEFPNRYEEWASRVHPEDLPGVLGALEAHGRDPERCPYLVEFRFRHKDGSWRRIQARGMTLRDGRGAARMLGSHIDVTELHEKDEMLRLSRVVFETAEEGIMVTDADNRIVTVNPAFTLITGYAASEAIGNRPSILSSGHHGRGFFQALWKSLQEQGSWHGEIANRHKSGKLYLEWLSIRAVVDQRGRVTHYVGIFSDITKRKEDEERMRYLAHYDALTGLPNRTLLLYRLQQALALARRDRRKVAVMFLDLDRFKPVNDAYGHEAGDQLLREVAQRLSGCVRESDTVARLGGDEFIVLLQELETQDDAALVARKIIAELERPFALGEHDAEISTSIGIAFYPDHGAEELELLRLADAAMYRSKGEQPGSFRIYAPGTPVPDGDRG